MPLFVYGLKIPGRAERVTYSLSRKLFNIAHMDVGSILFGEDGEGVRKSETMSYPLTDPPADAVSRV